MGKNFIVLTIYIIISLSLFFPLIDNFTKIIPGSLGDPLLVIWTFGWNIKSFLEGNILHIYDSNILYPYHKSLAFSENLFAPSLIGMPIFLISKNLIIVYNTIFILSFILSAFCTYIMIKEIIKSDLAAFIGGFLFSYNPWRFGHLPRIQILCAWWIPICFWSIVKYHKEKKTKYLIYFSISFVLNAFTNAYYMFFVSILIFIFELFYFILSKINFISFLKENFPIKRVVLLFILIFPIISVAYYPYYLNSKQMKFERNLKVAEKYSLDLKDYFDFSKNNLPYFLYYYNNPIFYSEYNSLLGILQIFLIVLAFIFLFKNKAEPERINLFSLAGVGLFAMLFSLGPILGQFENFIIWGPYSILRIIPGGSLIRAPSRFAVFVYLISALFASYAFNIMWKRCSFRKKIILLILAILLMIENFTMPFRYVEMPNGGKCPEVYNWLKKQEKGPVMEFPISKGSSKGARVIFLEPKYTYFSTCHWFPLFNGYSGFVPPYQRLARKATINLQFLLAKKIGIKYIIIHKDFMETSYMKRLLNKAIQHNFKKIYEDESAIVISYFSAKANTKLRF